MTVWKRPLGSPFAHGLLEQRNRRHQLQNASADACDGFRYAQRGKGLARAARHDHLVAIMLFESADHVVECNLLMGPQVICLTSIRQRLRFVMNQIGPVEWRLARSPKRSTLQAGCRALMVFTAFGPHSSPVSTKIRAVKGSRAEVEIKESRCFLDIRVPSAEHLHWMAQTLPSRSSATRSMPVSFAEKSGPVAAQSDQSQTFEKRSR